MNGAVMVGEKVTRFRARGKRCPICKEIASADYRPFCSKRCAEIDLGRWLGEVYRAPAEDDWAEAESWSENSPTILPKED